jgi:copper oxidase (laccase) domain-containing protein
VLFRSRGIGIHAPEIIQNRERFCEKIGIRYDDVVYQNIIYSDDATYDQLVEVGAMNTTQYMKDVPADGLFTAVAGVGLFLPVADCVATIVFDPIRKHLALLHLGRHSTLTSLIAKTVATFVRNGSRPADMVVWMSPSAKKDTYMLDWFDHADSPDWKDFCTKTESGYSVDLPGYNRQRFIDEGIRAENVTISGVDTTKDDNYFSHRSGDVADRIAVLAMMR